MLHLFLFAWVFSTLAAPKADPGLVLTLTSGTASATAVSSDTTVAPGITLFVPAGGTPSPFLPAGKFTAVWEGALNAELRSSFVFQVKLNGKLVLEINGAPIMETVATNGITPLTQPVRLNKGANPIKATFTPLESSPDGAYVRLEWSERGPFATPIPLGAFTHETSANLSSAIQRRHGRELFLEHRCIRCHGDPIRETGVPELKMDAPSFEGIGARRRYRWMAQWILEPRALRATARMPQLLHGPTAKADAEAIAAYLASLKSGEEKPWSAVTYRVQQTTAKPEDSPAPPAGERKSLYERLHCIGCHNPPDATEIDPAKISQKRVAEKFPAGKLAEYLLAPDAGYAWTRMPDFHLSREEAKELEDWLFAAASKPSSTGAGQGQAADDAPTEPALLEKGRGLVQTTGCLNCHSLKLDNRFAAPKLADVSAERWGRGCLAGGRQPTGKAPFFAFASVEIADIQAFGPTARESLARFVPAEFAERQARVLNCTACHGQLEGFPPLELLGSKLKPEWSARFIGGQIPHKIRYDAHPKGEPWLEARMPAFKAHAPHLAAGLAARDGFPPNSPATSAPDPALVQIGRKLVGKDGGFSCVSCHGVGTLLAMEVFESEGVNLVYSADRLQPDFYRRWLRAPTSVDSQTKMPVYFDEGKSPLTEILGGDAEKQIEAIWAYLQLRDKMLPPPTGAE